MGGPAGTEWRRLKVDDMTSINPTFFDERKKIFQQRSKSSFSEVLELQYLSDLLDEMPNVWTDLNVFMSMYQNVNEFLSMRCHLCMSY